MDLCGISFNIKKTILSSSQKHSCGDGGTGAALCWHRKRQTGGREGHHQKSTEVTFQKEKLVCELDDPTVTALIQTVKLLEQMK